jgi:hypothetical protein
MLGNSKQREPTAKKVAWRRGGEGVEGWAVVVGGTPGVLVGAGCDVGGAHAAGAGPLAPGIVVDRG